MAYAVGIDLGTSNSVVAAVVNGVPTVIPDAEGRTIHPSVVSFGFGASVIVGARAKEQIIYNPTNTVFSSKRLIGRHMKSEETTKMVELAPYRIEAGPNNDPRVEVQGRQYTMQEIGAFVLRYLRQQAENFLGEPVDKAVITVPAYFNDAQRQATRDAGSIAGLEVIRIINEPTAAALAYGLDKHLDATVAVYDLGGGTFDISVLTIDGDVFEVISTSGDTYLGGDDFDWALVDYFAGIFEKEHKINVRSSATARQKLKEAAEQAKIALSQRTSITIELPGLIKDDHGFPRDLKATLNRVQYNQMVYPLLKRSFKVCDEALQAANVSPTGINAVVMVGGMTRSPIITESVESYFNRSPAVGVNPDEVVAVGAAIQAHNLMQAAEGAPSPTLLIDVTPQTLGIEIAGGYVERLIERNSPIPCRMERVFATSSDNQTAVSIRAYQGESRLAVDNDLLGEFVFGPFEPQPRGRVRVAVTFDIDVSGILNVSAVDQATGHSQSMSIQATTTLSRDEVMDMEEQFDNLDF